MNITGKPHKRYEDDPSLVAEIRKKYNPIIYYNHFEKLTSAQIARIIEGGNYFGDNTIGSEFFNSNELIGTNDDLD